MILDLIVLAVLLVSAVIAFFRGFIREALTILGVVGGLVAAWFGGPALSPVVHGWFDTGTEEEPKKLFDLLPYDMVADAIAYGSIFIIVVIVLSIASHFLAGWAKAIGLGAIDRTLGVIFGLVRGAIIIALIYIPVSLVAERETIEKWEPVKESKTHFYIAATAEWLMALVPESFRENAGDKAEETADSMARATREKLQELDVLQESETINPPPQPGTEGYEKDERQDMNNLIENSFEGEEPYNE